MRRATSLLVLAGLAAAVAACSKGQPPEQDQNIAIDDNISNGMAGNADIVSLPADESSTTPSNQLANGFDNPDVNSVGAPSNSQ